jgi:3-methyladenine DNA glycosylase AlkC
MDSTESYGRMNVNNELERTYKQAEVPHFDMSLVSQHSHRQADENLSKSGKEKSISRF